MTVPQYSVSELRVASMCPRIHYFDAERRRSSPTQGRRHVTYIWQEGPAPAGGALLHRVIEAFTKLAATAPEVASAIRKASTAEELHQQLARYMNANCIDLRNIGTRSVDLRAGFVAAQHAYLEELASLVVYGRSAGVSSQEIVSHLFSERRKALDVTFALGTNPDVTGDALTDSVRVTGVIDYLFFDWRSGQYRLFDYKLTPPSVHAGDLMQVHAYALMHNQQHNTEPDIAVYYLYPGQRHIEERAWTEVWSRRATVFDHLASMLLWERYDANERRGLRPPGNQALCARCPYKNRCEGVLGDKQLGDFATVYTDQARNAKEPQMSAGADPEEAVVELERLVEPSDINTPEGVARRDTASMESQPAPVSIAKSRGDQQKVVEPPEGLLVGHESTGLPVVVPVSSLNTHVAVVGAAGSGKTWTAKVIAEEAVRNGVPVIAIDPQGDLVQFLRQRERAQVPERLRSSYDGYLSKVEPRIFTPGTSHATRLSLNPIRLSGAEELLGIADPCRRREEELSLRQAVAANLVSLADAGGDAAVQETFLYQILNALPNTRSLTLQNIVDAIWDPTELGIDEPDTLIQKSQREKLARRLNTCVAGPAASLFQGGMPLDLSTLVQPSVEGRVPLNVIYLNALANDQQKQFFVAALAAEIYRWMVTTGSGGGTNLLVYIDEARDYIPAGARETPAKQPLIRLFSQGRKYGVGCLVCTQSPRSVDFNIFTNCSTKIVGRLEAAQDVERVREWFTTGGGAPSWLAGRKGAEKGSFVARWEGDSASAGRAFTSRTLFSIHEGAWAPGRVESEVRKA